MVGRDFKDNTVNARIEDKFEVYTSSKKKIVHIIKY